MFIVSDALGVIRLAAAVSAAASRVFLWRQFYKHYAPNGATRFRQGWLFSTSVVSNSTLKRLERQTCGVMFTRR